MYKTITKNDKILLFLSSIIKTLFYIRFFVTYMFLLSFIVIHIQYELGITLFISGSFFMLISHIITLYQDIKDVAYGNGLYHRDKNTDIILRIILTPISKIHHDVLSFIRVSKLYYFIRLTIGYMDLIRDYTLECEKNLSKEDKLEYTKLRIQVSDILDSLDIEVKDNNKLTMFKDIDKSIKEIEECALSVLENIYKKDPQRRDDIIDTILEAD